MAPRSGHVCIMPAAQGRAQPDHDHHPPRGVLRAGLTSVMLEACVSKHLRTQTYFFSSLRQEEALRKRTY